MSNPHHNKIKDIHKKRLGSEYEQRAKSHLISSGLVFIEQNFRCKLGEIDLIFYDEKQASYVFVEVRYRNSILYGGAAASVDHKKQQKVKKSAIFYLHRRNIVANIRFDVVAFERNTLNWIESAFS
ncbi:YraN family protein [Psychrosphaera ytuae]|uniref:UPF0102 protein J1N51_12050 n=1 Tax=Psychrosphaera ytuae TaxID=2820710 RepID=A0A975DAB3_9GAMM|nr:YraN family protein [Psychrosphaera ytuae]QTH63456.1 YraN family protein [Psychrosphaera ytuae]